nr:superoxide dismutase family protein [Paenibacillus thalictri]
MTAAPAADKASSEAAGTMVDIVNGKGEKIGMASLKPQDGGVRVSVSAASLSPGEHGIHFHETGKCEAPDFKTAGSHLNPASKKHGFLTPEGPHAGDLPNLIVGADGTGKAEFTTKLVTLDKGKPNSLLKAGGTALVIHDKADDYITDPAGNSGDRIACGVIKG